MPRESDSAEPPSPGETTAGLDTRAAGGRAIRGGLLRVLGYALGVAGTVASAAVLFRHLGEEDSGRYVVVLSLVTLTAGVTDAGLSSLGVREIVSRPPEQREGLVRNLMGLRLAFSLTGVGLACAYAVLAGFGSTLLLGTVVAGAGVVVQNLQSTLATSLMADLRLGWVTVADLVRQLVTVIGSVTLVVAGAELVPFLGLVPIAGASALVVTAIVVRRSTPFLPTFDRGEWRSLLADTLPYALAVAVGAVYFRLSILLVELISNATETGYFGVSFRVVEVLVVVPQLVVGAGLPIFARAARDDSQRLRYGIGKMLDTCLLLGAAAAVGLGVGAPVALDVVAGEGFREAVPVLRWHALALFFSFVAAVFGYALLSIRRHRGVLAMNAAALVLVAATVPPLASAFGAEGAAAGTVIGELGLALAGFLLLARAGMPLGLGAAPRVALASGLALLPALLLPALPAACVAMLIFLLVARVVGAIPEELLVEVRGARGRVRRASQGEDTPR